MEELAAVLSRSPFTVLDARAPEDEARLRQKIRLKGEEFRRRDERSLLLPMAPAFIAAVQKCESVTAKLEHVWKRALDEGLLTECAIAMRSGSSVQGARCAVHGWSSGGPSLVLLFDLKPPLDRVANSMVSTISASTTQPQVQIYCSPTAAAPQPDSFWGEQWNQFVPDHPQYASYRQVIDRLIETAIREHVKDGHTDLAVREEGALRILEICAGDGSLAARVLRSVEGVGRYSLIERNAQLVASARERLADLPAALVYQGDATDVDVYRACAADSDVESSAVPQAASSCAQPPLSPSFSLCISAGSILCSQVGRATDAETVLKHVSACLVDGGALVATGISPSFVHPAALHGAGFEVVERGSYPSELTQCAAAPRGLDHGWGRLQFFVLRKVKGGTASTEGDVLFRALADVPRQL